jgi:hypothetical protein
MSTATLFQKREALRSYYQQGIKPVDGRQPIPEELAQQMVKNLKDSGISSDALIGVHDTFLTLTLTLQEHGFSNIVVLENEHRSLTSAQEKYYNTIEQGCKKIDVIYYIPPMNNYSRCDMKFDATIGNPPYKGQLHLEFLKLALEKSDYVSLIHPSGWLTRTEKSIEKDVKKLLEGRLKSLTIFNGVPVFKCEFQAPLVITEVVNSWDKPVTVNYTHTGNNYEIDSVYDFPTGYWEPTEINIQLNDKIKSLSEESNLLSLRTSNLNLVPLNLPTICGHPVVNDESKLYGDDFHTFFYHNSNIYTYENNEGKFYSLNNEEERENLISYLKTKFARFALALNKATNRNNVSRYIKNVPLLPLDQQWDDESVKEYFNISQEEWNSIDNFIPTYYK